MTTNILISFLRLLGVKHTASFSGQYFAEHPHKYNLFGLSSILSYYKINNAGVKVTDKNDITKIEPPFIAHTGNDFAIVEKIIGNKIHFIEGNKKVIATYDNFLEMWTGYTLIAEPDDNSIEPNYKTNFLKELFHNMSKIMVLSLSLLLIIFAFVYNTSYNSWVIISLFIISISGIYVGYLLVLKQLKVQSSYADKLCSLFKYNDCNNILDSKASKIFGAIGWSEIGLGYFISNVLILSFIPSLTSTLLFVNFFSLPYTVWSIWYQKAKAKQWCPLCLITMLLLWSVFIVGIFSGFFDLYSVTISGLLITSSLYLLAILIINILISTIARSSKMENIQYEINSIKADEDVFETLLKKQPRYEMNKASSKILFGNINSKIMITVYSNPHCNPCSFMHLRVNKLLEDNKNICVQYIFSSFNEELEVSNQYLIGSYLQKNAEARYIYDEWFEKGKFNKEEFFKLHPVDITTLEVTKEFKRHEQWKEQSGLRATPTILVNGYKLPDNFKIEDIKYITKL